MGTDTTLMKVDLESRLRFETMLADLSSRFVRFEPSAVDKEIVDAQHSVCECLGFDMAALWQLPLEEPEVFTMSHLFRPPGGPPVPERFDAREVSPWALENVLADRIVVLRSIDEAPPEAAADLVTWRHFGIKSVFCFPLSSGTQPAVGALSFHDMHERRSWPDDIVQRLQLVAQVFANAILRKRADEALRESEERLQLAAESGEIGMWMLDLEDQRFWASGRARRIFGYDPDFDITMDVFLESVQASCRESVQEAVQRAVEHGTEIDIEYMIALADGSERWVHSRGRFNPGSATAPRRILGATIDVTERKSAEMKLQESYEEVSSLRRQLELENAYLQKEQTQHSGGGRIVGESPAINKVLQLIEQVAPTETTILVEGETGTGKELVAHRIHQLSPRQGRPLVKVNCAALPSALVESELFGREKGAYTGAISREAGRFEVADGSTILLDEIAELPLELQAKLLRVLEEGQFERVGSPRTLTTDVRVIAATNRDLRAEVEAGRFRRDLFYRLAVFPIRVPPLRERRGDIPLLMWSFIQEMSTGMNKSVEKVRREDIERLRRHEWPGNVRELRNVVERALILCSGPTLRIEPPAGPPPGTDGVLSMEEVQRRHIVKVLEIAGGRIRGPGGAAELMGLKPTTLRSRMQRLGLEPRRLRDERSSS